MSFFLDDINYRVYIFFALFLGLSLNHNTNHWFCTTFAYEDSSCTSKCFCNLFYCCLYISIILCLWFALYTDIFKYLWVNAYWGCECCKRGLFL